MPNPALDDPRIDPPPQPLDERLAAETVANIATMLEAMGIDRDVVARALFVEAIARGRFGAASDEWIERLSMTTTALAKESSRGTG